MDSTHETIPELEDLLKKLDDADTLDKALGLDQQFLLDEVRFSNLRKMNDANLAGRLAYYERDYTFEMNPRKRREFHREVVRTKIEIRRRVLEKRAHTIAQALAEEAKPEPGTIELASAA
jgi:hypothetical protein